jgi:hypothetical protein
MHCARLLKSGAEALVVADVEATAALVALVELTGAEDATEDADDGSTDDAGPLEGPDPPHDAKVAKATTRKKQRLNAIGATYVASMAWRSGQDAGGEVEVSPRTRASRQCGRRQKCTVAGFGGEERRSGDRLESFSCTRLECHVGEHSA